MFIGETHLTAIVTIEPPSVKRWEKRKEEAMSEEVKCQGCHSTHSSGDYVERCFVCGRDVCFSCGNQRTVKATGRTVRVCNRCVTVQEPRLR